MYLELIFPFLLAGFVVVLQQQRALAADLRHQLVKTRTEIVALRGDIAEFRGGNATMIADSTEAIVDCVDNCTSRVTDVRKRLAAMSDER